MARRRTLTGTALVTAKAVGKAAATVIKKPVTKRGAVVDNFNTKAARRSVFDNFNRRS